MLCIPSFTNVRQLVQQLQEGRTDRYDDTISLYLRIKYSNGLKRGVQCIHHTSPFVSTWMFYCGCDMVLNRCTNTQISACPNYIQDDSKLLSGFPWPIIFKPEATK
jgi:hypothetical protein